MSSKTLETLVKHSDQSAKQPLELWKQLQRGKTDYRSSAAALAKRAASDVAMCAAAR
jgi:hypothetical protein